MRKAKGGARLEIEWVPICRVALNPANPRDNDEGVPHVAASLQRYGWQQPIVAKRSGQIIAGNTRLKAAKHLGMLEVPVIWFAGSELDALAYSVADNRLHEFSTWVDQDLAKILIHLREEDSLDGVGFDKTDVDELLRKLESNLPPSELDDQGPEEPPANPVSRLGDMWRLGDHLLYCADSTKPETYSRLLGGEKVKLLSTDPPYCVNYTGKDRPIHDGKPSGKDWTAVYREIDIADLGQFLDDVFASALPYLDHGGAIYCWHAHVQQPTIAAVFERHGLLLHQVIVWVKPCGVFGHSYYRWRHEPCAFGWRKGSKPKHGLGQLDTAWECDWEGKSRIVGNEHPTQKPLRLFEIPMEQHTVRGDTVLEPFCGSGSQLIAAERLGRRCRASDIQPAFVDVAIRRWQVATGKEARLEGEEKTYAEIAEERGIEA